MDGLAMVYDMINIKKLIFYFLFLFSFLFCLIFWMKLLPFIHEEEDEGLFVNL